MCIPFTIVGEHLIAVSTGSISECRKWINRDRAIQRSHRLMSAVSPIAIEHVAALRMTLSVNKRRRARAASNLIGVSLARPHFVAFVIRRQAPENAVVVTFAAIAYTFSTNYCASL
jgi:hypothetical protein